MGAVDTHLLSSLLLRLAAGFTDTTATASITYRARLYFEVNKGLAYTHYSLSTPLSLSLSFTNHLVFARASEEQFLHWMDLSYTLEQLV